MARPKKKDEEVDRAKAWYEEIARWINDDERGSKGYKKISKNFDKLKDKAKLTSKERYLLPTSDAWKHWEIGRRTPQPKIASTIDLVLAQAGAPPFSWILSPPEQIKLTPAFAWDPFESGLDRTKATQVATAHAAAHPYLLDGIDIISLTSTICNWSKTPEDIEWPPVIMLPASIGKTLPCKEGISLPWLRTPSPTEAEKKIRETQVDEAYDLMEIGFLKIKYSCIQSFIGWSTSKGHLLPGTIWLKWLKVIPGHQFFSDEDSRYLRCAPYQLSILLDHAYLSAMRALGIKEVGEYKLEDKNT